jgi:GNAT superfamily N-acetyltransferase
MTAAFEPFDSAAPLVELVGEHAVDRAPLERPGGLVLRRFGEHDDLGQLTELLHRSYRPLYERGMTFLAATQDVETTRERINGRECWIGCDGDAIRATVTFSEPSLPGDCPLFDRRDVAVFSQLAVDPDVQRHGFGAAMLACCEERAQHLGAAILACATAEPAAELVDWYLGHGYHPAGTAKWPTANYRSVLLAKRLRGS